MFPEDFIDAISESVVVGQEIKGLGFEENDHSCFWNWKKGDAEMNF